MNNYFSDERVEKALTQMAALLDEPTPVFSDGYDKLPHDAAMGRVYGRTRHDQQAEWNTQQTASLRSLGGVVRHRAMHIARGMPLEIGWFPNMDLGLSDNCDRLAARLYQQGLSVEEVVEGVADLIRKRA
jgi:hypothetical protein